MSDTTTHERSPSTAADTGLIVFFTEDQVARLVQLSVSTLRSWQQQGIVEVAGPPDSVKGPYSRFYDYASLVTLRLLSRLRKQHRVPLDDIRKTAAKLRTFTDDVWNHRISVVGRSVVFDDPASGRKVTHAGQLVLDLAEIERETRRDVATMLERPLETVGHVARHRNVLGNAATVAGTRVRTSSVRRFHDAGYTVEQIIRQYPDLTAQDVRAALEFEHERQASAA